MHIIFVKTQMRVQLVTAEDVEFGGGMLHATQPFDRAEKSRELGGWIDTGV